MDPLQFLVPLGWLSAIGPYLPFAILTLAFANLATRHFAHVRHVAQAEVGDSVERYGPHTFTNIGLVLLAFLFAIETPIGGTIMSVLVITMLLADLFEFESRNVEARNDLSLEAPKSAIAASGLVILYAGYYSFTFVVSNVLDVILA